MRQFCDLFGWARREKGHDFMEAMKGNVLITCGGGPTAVINASLYGVIREAQDSGKISKVYAAIGGSEAILRERFLDLLAQPKDRIERLLETPATAIGSSRYALTDADYAAMPSIFQKYGIKYVLLNGGNGTMDTCGRIFRACRGTDVRVVGIPKTVDNDIAMTDHTPGYGSAARYIAATTEEVGADVASLPIHVCIIEAMGRNAGWITAASALARRKKGDAPHLIYLPERPFHEDEFLEDVKRLYDELGGVVVLASEGLKNEEGEPIVPPVFQTGRSVYYGDVSAYLAELVIKKLGIKARSEKPGICGRASIAWQSPVDREEAILCGREALRAAMAGESGVMVGLIRDNEPDFTETVPLGTEERKRAGAGARTDYHVHTELIPIEKVMLYERKFPEAWINARGNDVNEGFTDWCRPLIGPDLREFVNFQEIYQQEQAEEKEK